MFFYSLDPSSIQLQDLLLTPGFLKLSDTCIYSLANTKPTVATLMQYGYKTDLQTLHANPTSKLFFLPLNFTGGGPRLKLANK